MDERTRKRVRRVSRALFGSSYRLEVAAAIAQANPQPVYARQLNADIKAGDNQVGAVLEHFEKAGIVKRLPSAGGREPQLFAPRPSPYWELCSRVLDDLTGSGGP